MTDFTAALRGLGLSDKAARVYLAALVLDGGSVQAIAEQARLQRTTVYYVLGELLNSGALIKAKQGRKVVFLPSEPSALLADARERFTAFSELLPQFAEQRGRSSTRPKVRFMYGVPGFKRIWERILLSPSSSYRIITDGKSLTTFGRDGYIVTEVIQKKRERNIQSRQLIVDSLYAREIIRKDKTENRESRLLPTGTRLPFTEVIGTEFVCLFSPKYENLLLIVESEEFADTRRTLFELIWGSARKLQVD